jgi:LL-diaminopimelate aminotransferase
MDFARRVENLPVYHFARIEQQVAEKRAQGIDIVNLGIGDPDRPTFPAVVATLQTAAADSRHHHYPTNRGLPAFREAVANHYSARFKVEIDPETEVLPVLGSKEGLAHLCMILLNPGDVALATEPGYPVYRNGPIMCDAQPVTVPLLAERAYQPDLDAIDPELADRAKVIFVGYPHNPTGAVIEDDFFTRLVDFAQCHQVLIVHDNAYVDITFDGYVAPSIFETPGAKEVAVEFYSLSKGYNMTGWRSAAILGRREVIDAFWRLKTNVDSGMFEAVQLASVTAMQETQPQVAAMCRVYQRRRDAMVSALRGKGLVVTPPKGTIYLWLPVPAGHSAASFTQLLLDQADLVVSPGTAYGAAGEGYIRISLSVSDEELEKAVARIETKLDFSALSRQVTTSQEEP